MPINDYSEKEIRRQILNKVNPEIKSRRSAHSKGYIRIENIVIAKVKIPNSHTRIMKKSKSQYIASALKLNDNEFNDLIDCPLTGPNYYKKLKEIIKPRSQDH